MEAQLFDRFSKSLARWTSRRRFLAGLAGATAGIPLAHHARALQNQDLEAARQAIVDRSTESGPWLEALLGQQEQYAQIDPLLPEFVTRLFNLTQDGQQAGTWSDDTVLGYLRTIELLPLAVSAGTISYLDQWADRRLDQCCQEGNCPDQFDLPLDPPSGIPETPEPGSGSIACVTPVDDVGDAICGQITSAYRLEPPSTCMSKCCQEWRAAEQACGADAACKVNEFWVFMTCLLHDPDGDPCTTDSDCGPRIMRSCDGNCKMILW